MAFVELGGLCCAPGAFLRFVVVVVVVVAVISYGLVLERLVCLISFGLGTFAVVTALHRRGWASPRCVGVSAIIELTLRVSGVLSRGILLVLIRSQATHWVGDPLTQFFRG